MALLESCCGCGLAISSAVLGVYLLVAYAIAFAVELWWILESQVSPPVPAYLLCLGYFVLVAFSGLLLHGLSVKRTTFLLAWLFTMGILLGPEAGLVLYLSIHCRRITSTYGLVEITCWTCRLLVNAIGLLCVQSLHSIWREEKSVLLRLEALKTSPLPKLHRSTRNRKSVPTASSVFRGFKNEGYNENDEKRDLAIYERDAFRSFETGTENFANPYYENGNGFSEFNASSFDPTVIDARLGKRLPRSTTVTEPKRSNRASEEPFGSFISPERVTIPKTRSLIDFKAADFDEMRVRGKSESVVLERPNAAAAPAAGREANVSEKSAERCDAGSLDRKIIKNKNLKILKRLSPFFSKKSTGAINIYRINPPKNGRTIDDLNVPDLDTRLNKVYSNRGMYSFDEKSRKIIFYPPEFFNDSVATRKFRSRIDSYGSSQSRSSLDTADSEDLRQISDVAL